MAYLGGVSGGLSLAIVLGLLTEQPASCYELDTRLQRRFESFDYVRGTARQAVMSLADEGFVRIKERRSQTPEHAGRVAVIYEPTPAGVDDFGSWVLGPMTTPPVREELDARIAFCGPEDLPRLIEIVFDAEAMCLCRVQELNDRLRVSRGATESIGWQQRMELVVSSGDHAWWDSRIRWLQSVRTHLEEELQRYLDERGESDQPS